MQLGNKAVDSNKISPNTVSNRLKPIKALLSANEVDVSWKLINKMLPRRTKSEDRAYTREEIHKMIECCTDVTDKVIVLMFSSAGFRLESWDYFCWKDVIFFQDKTQQYTGAALRVYRGDPEEYWTFITPEACRTLALYKEEWRSRFLKYPDKDDPLIASTRFDRPIRLQSKGVRARVDKIVTKIGLRDGIKKNQRRYEVKLDHGFRKYFNTMMRRAKVNYLDKEDMMGHKVGLEQAYERYQEEDFERFPEYWANKAINAKKSIEQGDTKKVRGYDSQSDLYAVHQTDLALLRGAIMSFPCWGAAVCPLVQTGWNAGESNVQLWWVPTDGNIGYESSVCLASDTHHNEVTFDMQTKRDLKNILQTWIYVYDNTVSVTLDGDEGECESNYYQRSVSAGSSAGLTTGISNISLN